MKGLLALSLLASAVALGADSQGDWREHQRGSLTWSARGVVAPDEGLCQHPSVECRKIVVEVRNDRGDAPIFCAASIQLPQPNAYAMHETGWRDWAAVEPGKTAKVNSAWVPKDLAIEDIHTECHARRPVSSSTNAILDVTDKPPRPPPPPVACSTKVLAAPDISKHYPLAAFREERQGSPVIRVTVKKGESVPDSVIVVASSNYPDLDQAAIEVAKASKYVTTCELGSVSFKVHFRITETDAT